MKPSEALRQYRTEIYRIVSENRSSNPRVFGSVLHGEDTETSDLDLLIDPTAQTTLMDLAQIEETLEKLMGIRVEVLTAGFLPESFRNRVLAEAAPV
ncbi:MAG TPA: nucleotidyltransferase domain-containing protein [Silvibacterium sp.]|nr:nucleotidyltransferase domain-containing protein [Silvibacterium sp.]